MKALRQQEPIVSYFDLPFTANPNEMLKELYRDPNLPPYARLLLFISRFSTGYLKLEVALREGFVLQETGMCRSSLYKAKSYLVARQKIDIAHTKTGNCVYRLAPHLQSLKAPAPKAVLIPQQGLPLRTLPVRGWRPPMYIKRIKKTIIIKQRKALWARYQTVMMFI